MKQSLPGASLLHQVTYKKKNSFLYSISTKYSNEGIQRELVVAAACTLTSTVLSPFQVE